MSSSENRTQTADGSQGTHLDVVVFGPGDHQVLVVSGSIHSQTHHWTEVTSKFPCGGKSDKET